MTLTLSAGGPRYRDTASHDPASFDLASVHPNGTVVDAERVEVTNAGYVDPSGDDRRGSVGTVYATRGGEKTFIDCVDDPTAGT